MFVSYVFVIKDSLFIQSVLSACLTSPVSGRWPERNRMNQPNGSAGRGVLERHGELLEEILQRLCALETHVVGAAASPSQPSPVVVDQAVQTKPALVDEAVQTNGSMPLADLLALLLVGGVERLLDDPVEGAGSPVTSTGTVALNGADTPPDDGRQLRQLPVFRRLTSCPETQVDSSVPCPSVPRHVACAAAASSPVPRSPVGVSSPSSVPRPRVPVVDSAAAEPEWTPAGGERMPLQERDRRMRQGRCLYCGERGHHIYDCPVRPPFKYGQ